MPISDFLKALPGVDLPLPDSKVTTNALRSPQGLTVIFTVQEDIELPPHSHGPQWGTVLKGQLILTMQGETRTFHPGESYDIPGGVEHAVKVPAGSVLLDIFAEPDRYTLKD